jgi:hypothetical protein
MNTNEELKARIAELEQKLCDSLDAERAANVLVSKLERQQAVLVEAIAKLAAEAGIINEGTGISGPQALMLLLDLRAALAAVKPAASPWLPIETAPQDGTPVDIFADGMRLPDMRRVQLGPDNVFYSPVNSGPSCVRDATHWMHLPAAPVKPAGQQKGSE